MQRLGCSTRVLIGAIVVLALFIVGFLSGELGASLFGGRLVEFFSLPKPHPELPAEEVALLFGFFPLTNTIIAAWVSIIFLVVVVFWGTRNMKLVPTGLQNIVETAIEMLLNFVEGAAGRENGRRFFPVVASLFLFVITNAYLGLFPGYGTIYITNPHGEAIHLLRAANTDVNLPLALALTSFVFVEYWGMTSQGFLRYISRFINVGQLLRGRIFSGLIDVFVGILEIVSELARIVSFTFRLFGNMTAGELLLLVASFLVPLVLAIPFYGLELLVGFVQALIFGGLTLVFAMIAVTPHGGEEH